MPGETGRGLDSNKKAHPITRTGLLIGVADIYGFSSTSFWVWIRSPLTMRTR
jgi:hypothetical protein